MLFQATQPHEANKEGYKLWCVANNYGNVYKFEIYTGKNGDSTSDSFKDLGLGGQVVWQLVESLKGKWHKFFYNYFSSVLLMESLQVNHSFACATIRPTRKDVPVMAAENSLKKVILIIGPLLMAYQFTSGVIIVLSTLL